MEARAALATAESAAAAHLCGVGVTVGSGDGEPRGEGVRSGVCQQI